MIEGSERRKQQEEGRYDAWGIRFPPWLIIYSDLITLLLTFFVLLMSMADLDPVRFTEASNSLKGAFGIRSQPPGNEVIIPVFPAPSSMTDPYRRSLINNLKDALRLKFENLDGGLAAVETFLPDSETILVRLEETLLFLPGSAVLEVSSHRFLDSIAETIQHHPIAVRIEGHADEMAAESGRFENSWELSTARAVSVLRYFVKNGLIDTERMSAVGYGAARPLGDRSIDADGSLKRRVDIILHATFPSGTTPAEKQRSTIPL